MTRLLSFRNPRTPEEDIRSVGLVARVMTTQLALPLVSIVAVVETISYAAISKYKAIFTSTPSNAHGLLDSSCITLLWSITCFAHTNYRHRKVSVEENEFHDRLMSLLRLNVFR